MREYDLEPIMKYASGIAERTYANSQSLGVLSHFLTRIHFLFQFWFLAFSLKLLTD